MTFCGGDNKYDFSTLQLTETAAKVCEIVAINDCSSIDAGLDSETEKVARTAGKNWMA